MKNIVLFVLVWSLTSCALLGNNVNKNASQTLSNLIAKSAELHRQYNVFARNEPGKANAQLPDLSPQYLLKKYQATKVLLQQLKQLDNAHLSQTEQINLAVLQYNLQDEVDRYEYHDHFMPLTAESGFHVDISYIAQQMQLKTVQDFQDYLSRLTQLPRYFKQQIYWMRQGLKSGITQPQVVLAGFESSIQAFIVENPEDSQYFQPFKNLPKSISKQQKQQLIQQAKQVIGKQVISSYQDYLQFFVNEYRPHARSNIAASSLANGNAFYANRVKHYTTVNDSIADIHQLGLKEVKRIHQQMQAIINQVGFRGSFAEFIEYLRTDPQFYAKTPEELLMRAAYIAKQMDGKLPSLFKTLPRNPYTVKPVPATIAPKYTTGRYSPPSRADQAGEYWVNTYRLDRRPLYVLESLTFHEAVPGHHLQGAIAREMQNVPEFRNQTYISAFGEGWGLYSEYLGIEAGFYQDPYSQFGRLSYEMWRACRLVVDTGMHAMGWSRQKAIDYLASNTALSMHNVKTEIDRYISWPAQALSYKMGELTIKKLRKKAEQSLADKFDLREFHDQILKNGSMPLSMLVKVIDNYIADKQKEGSNAK